MDPGKEEQELPKGLLAHLEREERRARGRARLQQRRRDRQEALRERLRHLRTQRDRLRKLVSTAAERGNSGISGIWDPREVLSWKIRECRERLRLYQLTGLSAGLCPQGVWVSLHCSCQGSLLGSFPLQLLPARGPAPGFRLRRHALPACVPLEPLRRQFLPQHPRAFLATLARHLGALGARRHQRHLLQEQFGPWLVGVPSGNSLCNLLSFRYRIPAERSGNDPGESRQFREFHARLQYRDPLRSLPTDVTVTTHGGVPVPEHSELLRSRALSRAMRHILT